MQRVLNTSMWIGNAGDARNARSLIEQEFKVVVDLALDESPAALPRELVYLRFPISDGTGNDTALLSVAVKTVAILVESPELKTAVCCSAGLSRSPAITAAGIAVATHRDPEEVMAELAAQTRCDVSPAFWSDVSKICRNLTF